MIKKLICAIVGHRNVLVTKEDGYYQFGCCPKCGQDVWRDGHYLYDGKWEAGSYEDTIEYIRKND